MIYDQSFFTFDLWKMKGQIPSRNNLFLGTLSNRWMDRYWLISSNIFQFWLLSLSEFNIFFILKLIQKVWMNISNSLLKKLEGGEWTGFWRRSYVLPQETNGAKICLLDFRTKTTRMNIRWAMSNSSSMPVVNVTGKHWHLLHQKLKGERTEAAESVLCFQQEADGFNGHKSGLLSRQRRWSTFSDPSAVV